MITLFDNLPFEQLLSPNQQTDLLPYANVPLKQLKEEHSELLVFPDCLGAYGDNWKDEALFELNGSQLVAGNVVGFFSVNQQHVHIQSRFDDDANKKKQYFLHYMLGCVFGVNILNLPTLSDQEPLWDFLLYLFPFFLKRAFRQGILRVYQTFKYNDAHVRGGIDIARHIRQNIPFNGCIAYQTRELSSNNHIIQLIRHTVEAIRINPFAGNILAQDDEMRKAVQLIIELTPDFNRQVIFKVISQNLRPVRHPYYTEYNILQNICLRILRHEKIAYGDSEDKIHGIVFKAEWLWEEYLATILDKFKIKHAKNTLRSTPEHIYLYTNNKNQIYPDFFNDDYVMDAKYKHLDNGFQRNDRFQLISYLHVRKARAGILIYPMKNQNKTVYVEEGILNGFGGKIGSIAFAIPQTKSFSCFPDYYIIMRQAEDDFRNIMLEILK